MGSHARLTRDGDLLLHPRGQLVDLGVGVVAEIEHFHHLVDPLRKPGPRNAVQFAEEAKHFAWGKTSMRAHVAGQESDLAATWARMLVLPPMATFCFIPVDNLSILVSA